MRWAKGDLSHKIEATSNDELGRITRNFESMVETLAARDAHLKEATDRLIQSEKLATIGRMAAHVTHEVRNPLSSIGLNVELLEEELSDSNEETRNLLREIRKEIDRLTAITEEYLRLKRVPTPRLEAEDLGEVASSVTLFMEAELKAAGVNVNLQVDSGLPKIPNRRTSSSTSVAQSASERQRGHA